MATPEDLYRFTSATLSLVLMGIDVRCVVSERHQSMSISVVACLHAVVYPGLSQSRVMVRTYADSQRLLRISLMCLMDV